MPSLNDIVEAIPRKTMVLYFIVDTSGSMAGEKIGALNSAVEEVVPELSALSASNADAQVKIAVLEFSTGTRWITEQGPIEAESFVWNRLAAGGITDMGDAFTELNAKLSTKGFMQEASGSFAPVIFLMSDGGPTDDYRKGLDLLAQNNWFKKAIKVAVAIGSDADIGVLSEFTGNLEAVLQAHSAAVLKKMIKFVSVRSSEVVSKSSNTSIDGADTGSSKQTEFINQLSNFKEDLDEDDDDGDW